jgi:hypothetical protein
VEVCPSAAAYSASAPSASTLVLAFCVRIDCLVAAGVMSAVVTAGYLVATTALNCYSTGKRRLPALQYCSARVLGRYIHADNGSRNWEGRSSVVHYIATTTSYWDAIKGPGPRLIKVLKF